MPEVQVEATVELHQGNPLIVRYTGRTSRGRGQWDDLEQVRWSGNSLAIPSHQFSYTTKVEDVVRAVWNGGVPVWRAPGTVPAPRPTPGMGAIVVVLESPHEDEYDYSGGQFRPIEPLADESSNKRLRCHMVRLALAAAAAKQVQLRDDVDIVLVNPIQFQTSIHRLVRLNGGGKGRLRASIRNATWRGMWNHQQDSSYPFQVDFANRLIPLQPCLVINACTCALREDMLTFFGGYPHLPMVEVTNHPSVWDCETVVGSCRSTGTQA